jgi:hypothetical protein
MANATDFAALMTKHNVPMNDVAFATDERTLDEPIEGEFFHGKDNHGRVFVNLPVTVEAKGEHERKYTIGRRGNTRTFIVCQRWANHDGVFVATEEPAGMNDLDLLGENRNDLTYLGVLLSGQPLTFYATKWVGDVPMDDPDNWIKITLARPV